MDDNEAKSPLYLRYWTLDKAARWTVLFLAGVYILFSGSPVLSSAREKAPPFFAGEKLIFKLRWLFIPAGEAVLEVLPVETLDGAPVYHFVMTARSNAFIDRFYKVRDRIDAWADTDMTHTLRYQKKQQEGRTRRDIVVDFDWDHNQVRYTNFNRSRAPVPILPGTFDPLSAFYYVRGMDLKEGMEIQRPVTDGKKSVIGRAKVVKRETIHVAGKIYDTYLLEPELRHVGGVFEKSKNAKIRLWVTADHRRLPVRIKSKVVVGSFTGELISTGDVEVP